MQQQPPNQSTQYQPPQPQWPPQQGEPPYSQQPPSYYPPPQPIPQPMPPPSWQQPPMQPGQPFPEQPPVQPWQPQMPPQQPYPPLQNIINVNMTPPQQIVNVNIQQQQPGLFVRALYFLFIGWWAGLFWLQIGYLLVLTIIGLPFGLLMLNRLPMVLTLKPAKQTVNISVSGSTTNITIGGTQQYNFWLRALYFVFVGWWAGLFWSYIAYCLYLLIVTIPVGVMMLNLLPAVITLRRD